MTPDEIAERLHMTDCICPPPNVIGRKPSRIDKANCVRCLTATIAEAVAAERERCARKAKHEIMVRAKANKMGAGLIDPDGSVFGEKVAECIRHGEET